jgi:hypothetical protein
MFKGDVGRSYVTPVGSFFSSEFAVPLFSRRFLRRRAISLATTLSVSATSFAFAQDPTPHEEKFLFDNGLAVSKLTRSVLVNPSGDIDRDFVDIMIPHHQGTIDMARAEMKYGHNDKLRQLAERIVRQQEQEISVMRNALPSPVSSAPSENANLASKEAN